MVSGDDSHLSDQYGYFSILPISPTESEAAYVLDGLFDQDTVLDGSSARSFMIEWYSSPTLRRRCQAGLNKGEAAHKLKRAVFFHERGEIRDRSFESQAFRAQSLRQCDRALEYGLS